MRALSINKYELLHFEVDIQSQTKFRVWNPKNPILQPGGHFKSDVAENL